MTNQKVDEFLSNADSWQTEMTALRAIVLDCGLTEEFKWKQPCYTFQGKNILIVSKFKEYCVLSFIKGVLLQDEKTLLVSPGENSNSVKFMKFDDLNRIKALKQDIKAYIYEAIEVEKAGLKVPKNSNSEPIPEELRDKMKQDEAFKISFEGLTTGRQRAYLMFFNAAKQSNTKVNRIEKYTSRILKGKGMNDCICGLSKRMPNCDGSHKQLDK